MGLTQSPLFRPVAGVTAIASLAAATLPAPSTTVSFVIAATVVVLVGIPHGAVDHLVANATSADPTAAAVTDRFDWPFHVRYVSTIVTALLVWAIAPTLALAMFLLASIHHFGQSDLAWCRLPTGHQLPLQWSRGLLLVGLPLVAHLDVVAPTIERLGGGRPDEWRWLADHTGAWSAVLILQHVVVGAMVVAAVAVADRASGLDVMWIRRELVGVAVLVALFVFADPLVGFAVYFGLWHSLGHVLVVRQTLGGQRSPESLAIGWRAFGRLALPRTLLSTLGVVGVVGAFYAAGRPDGAVAALFVLVSVITVPHLVVVERLWRAQRRPAERADQGMRARLRNRPENAATVTAIDDAASTASPSIRS
jgi:beta-carotene 15,15'-dioxygenase